MSQLFANNASSILSAAIAQGDTTITVLSGSVFPSPAVGDYFVLTLAGLDANGNEISWEIVKVTARDGNELTVIRAQEGTTDKDWPSGTRAELRVTAGVIASFENTPEPSAATYTYTDGVVTSISETVDGATRTTTISYNNGLVSTVAVSYGGKTWTETYTYTNGVLTGMTATEA